MKSENRLPIALFALFTSCVLLGAQPAFAQATLQSESEEHTTNNSAWISIDGKKLFELRGVKSYPALERVGLIKKKVIQVAKDGEFDLDQIKRVSEKDRTSIYAGDTLIVSVFDLDGEFEGIDRDLLASLYQDKIAEAIADFRTSRSSAVLIENSAYALGATVIMALVLWLVLRLTRWLSSWAERRVQKNVETLASKSHHLIRAAQVWTVIGSVLRGLRILAVVLLVYFYLNLVLGLYPWTRPIALVLFELILNPLESIGRGFLNSIPDLSFLVILFFVVRYMLRLVRLFFEGIDHQRIRLQNFDPDWAMPTFKIIRFLIVAFSVVVAYPYIPGSDSLAFKGVSLFLGVIFSLGSSSFIANVMAGLSMTYRGAFKEGERVKIGDVVGTVEDIKLMITRIRTHKNEMVVVPNSNILSTNVVNYSNLAREQGLVLHTIVGIGYDTPWRQVEALLLMAAGRTQGVKQEPAPFVLQLSLGDFAVNYELNLYSADENRMLATYSELHAHIQDVFNEHGVQIMSPAYEADPELPKVVPPEQWYASPAVKPKS